MQRRCQTLIGAASPHETEPSYGLVDESFGPARALRAVPLAHEIHRTYNYLFHEEKEERDQTVLFAPDTREHL